MCLNETWSEEWIGRHLSNTFPVRNGLKQGDALLLLLCTFALEYAVRRVPANQRMLKRYTSASSLCSSC